MNTFNEYSKENPEKVLEFSDWIKIPTESYPVSLKRLSALLIQAKVEIVKGG